MNAQEREQLNQFLKQMTETRLPQKDQEAERLIQEAAVRQPDALYLLTQRAMLLEQALSVSKNQLAELQNQLATRSPQSGFLPNDPWAQPQPSFGQSVPGAGQYQVPRYQTPAAAANTGAPSFLSNVASTAAGVVAGSFLFQGIESLLGHHSAPWGHDTMGAAHDQADQVTINNYYGEQDAYPANPMDADPVEPFGSDPISGDDFGADDSGWI